MAGPYRVTHKRIHRGGRAYEVGEETELSERAVEAFSDRIEPVEESPEDEQDAAGEEPPFDPAEYTVSEVTDLLADVESSEALEAIVNREMETEDRVGVREAVRERQDELEE